MSTTKYANKRIIVHVVEARNLVPSPSTSQQIDPYIVLQAIHTAVTAPSSPTPTSATKFKTKVVKKSLNPLFNQWFTLFVASSAPPPVMSKKRGGKQTHSSCIFVPQ